MLSFRRLSIFATDFFSETLIFDTGIPVCSDTAEYRSSIVTSNSFPVFSSDNAVDSSVISFNVLLIFFFVLFIPSTSSFNLFISFK